MAELEPCPFCGGEGDMNDEGPECAPDRFWACCPNPFCFVEGAGFYATEEEAAQAWNTRYGRTCEVIGEWGQVSQTQEFRTESCSKCGHEFGVSRRDHWPFEVEQLVELPNYCPDCGCRVVGAKVVER